MGITVPIIGGIVSRGEVGTLVPISRVTTAGVGECVLVSPEGAGVSPPCVPASVGLGVACSSVIEAVMVAPSEGAGVSPPCVPASVGICVVSSSDIEAVMVAPSEGAGVPPPCVLASVGIGVGASSVIEVVDISSFEGAGVSPCVPASVGKIVVGSSVLVKQPQDVENSSASTSVKLMPFPTRSPLVCKQVFMHGMRKYQCKVEQKQDRYVEDVFGACEDKIISKYSNNILWQSGTWYDVGLQIDLLV